MCVHIHTRLVMGNQVLGLDPAGRKGYCARDCPVTRISQNDLRALPSVFSWDEPRRGKYLVIVEIAPRGTIRRRPGSVFERRSSAVWPGKALRGVMPGRNLGGTVREHDQPRLRTRNCLWLGL